MFLQQLKISSVRSHTPDYLSRSGSNIRVDSPGNFETESHTEPEFKHPRQSTEAEFCHLFLQE